MLRVVYYGGDQGGIGMFFIHIFTGIGSMILLGIAVLQFALSKRTKGESSPIL